jgi:hypothetical protein
MSSEIIQNTAYDNYDDFQHVNFIFFTFFLFHYFEDYLIDFHKQIISLF